MSDKNKTPEMMLQIDHKDAQRRQNYRRAEAFLVWKFGPMYDEATRFLRGSGMDWPSLFVEFVEKVEEQLLARMREYGKVHFDWLDTKAKCNMNPLTVPLDRSVLEKVEAKHKAYNEALERGDVAEMQRLASKGPTYGQVVRPHTKAEEQRMIDLVNKAREDVNPQTIQLTDEEVENLSKDWPGIRVEAGEYEWVSGKPLKDCKKEKA